ncbi:MAG: chemotaxis protein CheA [Dehalococcoidales bacterium]|nr:chemotaxis protein CheA [Dehalococcoidales bacterium]
MELAGGINQEDLKLFLQEADEQIQLLDEDIIRLEKEAANPELLQEIFRAAHTLKGSSAMVGHQRMSELAHAMENVLDGLRKGTLAVGPSVVDALLHGLDMMRLLRKELVQADAPATDITTALKELAAVMQGDGTAAETSGSKAGTLALGEEARAKIEKARQEGKRVYRLVVALDKESSWASVRCFQIIQELSALVEIVASHPSREEIESGNAGFDLQLVVTAGCTDSEIMKVLNGVPEIASIAIGDLTATDAPGKETVNRGTAGGEKPQGREETTRISQSVRVDVTRLDTLMEQVGELVIGRNQISQISRMLANKYHDDDLVQSLNDCVAQMSKIVSMLQQDVMSIRLLPIEIVFNTLPRLVRDVARKLNKKVDFIIEGQETEVDRSVIEHLKDPLMHLLRNAVDHGIEPPEERLASGKPETGTVCLSAYHHEDNIIITLQDDGRGIDPKKIRQSAVKKGLLTAEAAERLSDEEAINLIFASGFSTAQKVTDLSGRGVGLDVVKTNVELLGGSVAVTSEAGRGTTFTLTLPLTLAIIPALLVDIGGAICAVPLSSIVESNKLKVQDIKTVRGREVTMFRGNVLPLLRLEEIFGWSDDAGENAGAEYVVVVKYAGSQVGLVVDALLEQQELVVKSLDHFVGGSNGITGASILGDGRVVLILDVASLVRNSVMERRLRAVEENCPGDEVPLLEGVG